MQDAIIYFPKSTIQVPGSRLQDLDSRIPDHVYWTLFLDLGFWIVDPEPRYWTKYFACKKQKRNTVRTQRNLQIEVLPGKISPGQRDQQPVEFYLSDVISNSLCGWWWAHHSPVDNPANASNVFVFPKVVRCSTFDFAEHMKEDEHKKACQLVVDVLGLQVSTEFRGGLGAKSVRKGNAAVLGAELRGRCYMNCISSIQL